MLEIVYHSDLTAMFQVTLAHRFCSQRNSPRTTHTLVVHKPAIKFSLSKFSHPDLEYLLGREHYLLGSVVVDVLLVGVVRVVDGLHVGLLVVGEHQLRKRRW